ncbi:unnamed protein product [Prorocentrum cordatum]|uniref:Protein kinase domain-containing protein n=1 Tax=Prorocentrum cordatum TaxID=2364126 RepID=A0ABN9XXL4_9DINO|nr:unnamed protein product [Polarella glacialis]
MRAVGDAVVPGLAEWLAGAGLAWRLRSVEAWCERMGASTLEEVLEAFDELAEDLGLARAEREELSPAHRGGTGSESVLAFGPPECPRKYAYAVKSIGLSKLRRVADYPRILEMLHQEVAILFSLQHPRETCGCVFVQVAEGLRYIHSRGVAHRDLKPDNVLVCRSRRGEGPPEVKLTDFGHSRVVDDHFFGSVGTPLYMAPEVSAGLAAVDDRDADLWSLGVVLFVMLRYRLPAWLTDAQARQLRADLRTWMLKFRCSALTRGADVVITYGDDATVDWDRVRSAHAEVAQIMNYHIGARRPCSGTVEQELRSRGGHGGARPSPALPGAGPARATPATRAESEPAPLAASPRTAAQEAELAQAGMTLLAAALAGRGSTAAGAPQEPEPDPARLGAARAVRSPPAALAVDEDDARQRRFEARRHAHAARGSTGASPAGPVGVSPSRAKAPPPPSALPSSSAQPCSRRGEYTADGFCCC